MTQAVTRLNIHDSIMRTIINVLIFRFIVFCLLPISLGMSACGETTDFKKIEAFLLAHDHQTNLEEYDYLLIINEGGKCLNCNDVFARVMAKFKTNNNILYIVSGEGVMIDISAYLFDSSATNIILDEAQTFSDLNLVNQCAIIALDDQQIDTIIEINLENMKSNINSFTKNIK